jgi:ribonuclease HII
MRTDRRLAAFDRKLSREGYRRVAGIDEAGRGSLAGPVVAAAVILPEGIRLDGLDDSKRLAPAERERQALRIRESALAFGFAFVGPRRIDTLNIRQASLLAMRRSLSRARVLLAGRLSGRGGETILALVDGLDSIPGVDLPQRTLIEGDGRSLAVAAASVIAKTVRDSFMVRLGAEFPAYGFERHKGYGTDEHLEAIERFGPCPWHRWTFAPVAQPSLFSV